MTGPHPAVAATRNAVREALDGVDMGSRDLGGLLGWPRLPRARRRGRVRGRKEGYLSGAIIVDHGLTPESAVVAEKAVAQVRKAGIAHRLRREGGRGPRGRARGRRAQAPATPPSTRGPTLEGGLTPHILMGHTMDDQAETVLLALGEGLGRAGARGDARQAGSLRAPLPVPAPQGHGRRRARRSNSSPGSTPRTSPTAARAVPPCAASSCPHSLTCSGQASISGLARSAALLQADADELERQARSAIQASESAGRRRGVALRHARRAARRDPHPHAQDARREQGDGAACRLPRGRARPTGHDVLGPGRGVAARRVRGPARIWQADHYPPSGALRPPRSRTDTDE